MEEMERFVKVTVDTHNELVNLIKSIRENKVSLSKVNLILSSCVVELRNIFSSLGIGEEISNSSPSGQPTGDKTALIKRWRKEAVSNHINVSEKSVFNSCADQLEKLNSQKDANCA